MVSASAALMPKRALQTWGIRLPARLNNLICCSSQKPISRSRCVVSGDAASCLMHTTVPAWMRLNGQMPSLRALTLGEHVGSH